jgi:hypothetical protein
MTKRSISINSTTNGIYAINLPVIKAAKGKTIFNQARFLSIYDRVLTIRPGAQRRWGLMNVAQMLNHLKISTAGGLKVLQLKDESSFLSRTFIKFIVLYVLPRLPRNIEAPQSSKREINQVPDFDEEKQQVLLTLEKVYTSSDRAYPHPMFGSMSRAQWGRLIYRHFDHHLRQFGA